MRTRVMRLVFGAALAAVTLAAAVGSASANTLSFTNQNFRIVWTPMELVLEGGPIIRCNATFEGRFHSVSIGKVAGNLIGYVTRAIFGRPCEGAGRAWTLNGAEEVEPLELIPATTLPWHVKYRSFNGTLPRITGINIEIIDLSFMTRIMEILCLYRSTTAEPARFIFIVETTGQLFSLTGEEMARIPRASGNLLCPNNATLRGNGSVRLLGTTTTLIFVRLI